MSLLHVGVGSFANHMRRPNRWLRRYALFFDRMEITDLNECLYLHQTSPHGKSETLRECNWLVETGYLSQIKMEDLSGHFQATEIASIDLEISSFHDERELLMGEYESHLDPDVDIQLIPDFLIPTYQRIFEISGIISALLAERSALVLRLRGHAIATNVEMLHMHGQTAVDIQLTAPSLLRFVINGLPVPAQGVPWSEILAFKAEEDSEERLRSLRAWLATTARGGITLAEASDLVADSLAAYRQHMRGAGIAHELATWEALLKSGIVSPSESIIGWMNGQSTRPFNLTASSAGTLAERYAPGHELSYLVKIEEAGL